jgi:carbon-monoxide dehydrogenase medium subunit
LVKAAPFDVHAPTSVTETADLLRTFGDEAKVLAGGQSLLPMLALRLARFAHLIDVHGVEDLQGIERHDGGVRIGAMTPQVTVGRSPEVAGAVPLLHRATPLIGHFQIRERGTLGGSLAHADPAAEYPAVAMALGARFEIARGDGERRVLDAAEFFVSTFTTALGDDDLLVAVEFPTWSGSTGFAIEEVARRHGDFAIAGSVCGLQVVGGQVSKAAVALFGIDGVPRRAVAAEAAMVGADITDLSPEELGRLAADDVDPPSDIHGSGAFRRRVVANLTARGLGKAIAEVARA